MANSYFSFKQFTVNQEKTAFKVGTDGVLLGAAADPTGCRRILDVGTGTGLIALMLAQRSDSDIVAIEPDHNSFLQASENIRISRWNSRISILNCRLQDYFPGDIKFDLIVSNPPYFINSLKNPDTVLSATRHNISLSQEELLGGASRLLDQCGKFQVIMPYAEGIILIAAASGFGLFCNSILKIKSVPSSPVRRLIISFSREKLPVTERFLTIEKGRRHDFTEDYKNLTRDFYLKF